MTLSILSITTEFRSQLSTWLTPADLYAETQESSAVSGIDTHLSETSDSFSGANVADCLLVPVFDIAMCWVSLITY